MLHILLLILKVIGIIFAVILGILVLLACVVLYVPVRYRLAASCDGTFAGIRAKAKATWLLHLIGFQISYEDKELSWQIRIAWKSIKSGQEEKKTEVETYDEEMEELRKDLEEENAGGEAAKEESRENREDLEENTADSEAVKEEGRETCEVLESEEKRRKETLEEENTGVEAAKEEGRETGENLEEAAADSEAVKEEGRETREDLEENAADSETVKEEGRETCEVLESEEKRRKETLEAQAGPDADAEEDGTSSQEEQRSIWQKITGVCQSIWQKITGLYHKITGLPRMLGQKIRHIGERAGRLLEKKDKIAAFLTDEVHKKAFVKVKNEVWSLLRKLKPKRFLAEVHYGFEDPSLTGKVLAGFGVVYPFLGDGVKIYPDFEKRILKGQVQAAGKIRGSYFVWLLWKLVWCKEVRMTYRHVRKFKL